MIGLLVACVGLAALFTVHATATLAAVLLWRMLERPAERWSGSARARALFWLRLFPLAAAVLAVVLLVVPSYMRFEPWPPDEVLGPRLAALAALPAAGMLLALGRIVAWCRATRRLRAVWLGAARPLRLPGLAIPAYRVAASSPVLGVAGVFRPCLLVTDPIVEALDAGELAASAVHEAGHVAARDNLKGVLVRVCRDLLGCLPVGRSLDSAWAQAVEAAADEHAARRGPAVALDLAGALVKVARLVPRGAELLGPTLSLVGDPRGGIAWRVRRLTEIAETGFPPEQRSARLVTLALQSASGGFLAFLAYGAGNARILASLHDLMERIFPFLG